MNIFHRLASHFSPQRFVLGRLKAFALPYCCCCAVAVLSTLEGLVQALNLSCTWYRQPIHGQRFLMYAFKLLVECLITLGQFDLLR